MQCNGTWEPSAQGLYCSLCDTERRWEEGPPFHHGALKQRLRPSQPHRGGWIYAERQHGTYPESTGHNGKWMVFPLFEEIDAVWFLIADAIEQGKLGNKAKVATHRSYVPGKEDDGSRVICIYTYDSEDKDDLLRILRTIRALGIEHKAFYKEDSETHAGNYAGVNILNPRQPKPLTRSPVKYWAREGKVELLVPKSRR